MKYYATLLNDVSDEIVFTKINVEGENTIDHVVPRTVTAGTRQFKTQKERKERVNVIVAKGGVVTVK